MNIGGLTNKNIRIRQEYETNKKTCTNCGSAIPFEKRRNRFCCSSCMATFTQKDGGNKQWNEEEKKKLSDTMKKKYSSGELTVLKKQHTQKVCEFCKNKFSVPPSKISQRFCSKLCCNTGLDRSKNGGYRTLAGKGKMGWYKGIYCNSSWELAWVVYSLEHNVKFKRNTLGFEYIFNGKTYKYYPDFNVGEHSYVEVKGWNSPKWEAKKQQFKYNLEIIGRDEMKKYLAYVIDKYGKNFTDLYENAPVI